jgi:hypothetical protein
LPIPQRVLRRTRVVDGPKRWLSRRDILANITKIIGGRSLVFARDRRGAPGGVATGAAAK